MSEERKPDRCFDCGHAAMDHQINYAGKEMEFRQCKELRCRCEKFNDGSRPNRYPPPRRR